MVRMVGVLAVLMMKKPVTVFLSIKQAHQMLTISYLEILVSYPFCIYHLSLLLFFPLNSAGVLAYDVTFACKTSRLSSLFYCYLAEVFEHVAHRMLLMQ